MSIQTPLPSLNLQPLPDYKSILLAVDSSDHANRAIGESVALAGIWGSRLSAVHVYAAKLHDNRFRQMEGGLPKQFREEQELERQRDVHDDLITRGLSIITDSYLDQVEQRCKDQNIGLTRRSLEGKNYRELVRETNSGDYDLLVIGALGLGAVKGSRLGTVCQRVARRSDIDSLIIKEPSRSIAEGPIVVAVDGSAKSYGGLLTALSLAQTWQVPVKLVSAFDPYYHYVAFNRIAGVLSEEAGKVFRFQEQEKLHEEIIDSGLAKIYQGHLSVANSIAADHDIEVETVLLDGKPHDVIRGYLKRVEPSLLVIGKIGIHADPDLDIGGTTEALLHDADCAVLLSQREHQPQVDRLASVTTSWTREAEARMERVPSFVRSMARMAILRYAQERGHTVITESIVEETTAQLMPGHAEQAMREIVEAHDQGELKRKPAAEDAIRWSDEATRVLLTVQDLSLRGNLSLRAEKKARAAGKRVVEAEHLNAFLDEKLRLKTEEKGLNPQSSNLHWNAAALARLMRVPEGFMRDSSKQRIEEYARANGYSEITLVVAEQGLAEARKAMAARMRPASAALVDPSTSEEAMKSGADHPMRAERPEPERKGSVWTGEARGLLDHVPAGFCRDMTMKAAETIASGKGLREIDRAFIEKVLETFQAGSETAAETIPWEDAARERIQRAPDMVRGMLMKEIEGWAQQQGLDKVTGEAVDAVRRIWEARGVFHLDPNDPRNQ